MTERVVVDLKDLPTYGFGAASTTWWGTLAFMALEGTGFVLAIAMYLYLGSVNRSVDLGAAPPDLLPGTIVTALLVVSTIPNLLLARWARSKDMTRVRIGIVLMSILGILPLIARVYEFPALNIAWNTNAYGSTIWFLLGLHTVHLVTDVGDTLVLTALMFTRHAHSGRRFGDVDDNTAYWTFVVLSWLVIYGLIYWLPRAL